MDWQTLLQNLQANNKMNNDATSQLVDRAKMATNPQLSGPPLPPTSTPEELKYSQAVGQGVMGIASPVKIAKSVPWMKNLTEGTVNNAVPMAEGLVNSAKTNIYTEAAKAAQKFQALKNKLGGR